MSTTVTAKESLGGTRMQPPAPTLEVPLKFARHNFDAFCYNALGCRVDYNNFQFAGPDESEDPDNYRSPPPKSDYKKRMDASYLGIPNFPPPAEVRWKSLDGVQHEAKVDIAEIFKDELIWHNVPKDDMFNFYEGPVAGDPDIMLEVNDRTINVYTRMFVPTKSEQTPGNKHSNYRDDLFLVWTRTY